jgi:hypothetical protein
MNPVPNALEHLAFRMRCDDPHHPEGRSALQRYLLPMIRTILRTGRGAPALVRWVRRACEQVPQGTRNRFHPGADRGLAVENVLCQRLMQHLERQPIPTLSARETLVGL